MEMERCPQCMKTFSGSPLVPLLYIEQQHGSKVSGGRVACAFSRLRDAVDYWDVIDVQKHGLLITCGQVHVIFAWHVCVFDVSVMTKIMWRAGIF